MSGGTCEHDGYLCWGNANIGNKVECSLCMVVTEVGAMCAELAAKSPLDVCVSGFQVAAGATVPS